MILINDQTDLIDIAIYYTETKNKFGVTVRKIIEEAEAKKLLSAEKPDASIKQMKTKWRPQTWQISVQINQNSTIINPATAMREYDMVRFNQLQVVYCLADWDIADEQGRKVPVTEENINRLPAQIATALLSKYGEAINPDE